MDNSSRSYWQNLSRDDSKNFSSIVRSGYTERKSSENKMQSAIQHAQLIRVELNQNLFKMEDHALKACSGGSSGN